MQFKLRPALDHFLPVDTKKYLFHSVDTMRRQPSLNTQKRIAYKQKKTEI